MIWMNKRIKKDQYGLIIYRSEKHLQNANFRRLYINVCSGGRIDGVLPLAVAEYSQKVEKARGQHGRKALQLIPHSLMETKNCFDNPVRLQVGEIWKTAAMLDGSCSTAM